jgi:hypothetical protein
MSMVSAGMQRPSRHRRGLIVGLTGLYLLLALWSTGPLVSRAASMLPVGMPPLVTVPLLNVWTVWWNADRAARGFAGYWNAPIFHPTPDALAFSEPQPMTVLAAPIVWLSGSRVLAYNVYLWSSLVLNGLATVRLLLTVGVSRSAAAAGGTAMVLLPFVHWQRDVLQLIPLWGLLWTWTAGLRMIRQPGLLRGSELGLAFTAAAFISIHQALLLAVLLAGSVWTIFDRWRDLRLWTAVLAAGLVAGLLAGPVLLHMQRVLARHQFVRPVEQVAQLTARPGDYTSPAGQTLFPFSPAAARDHWRLGPGWCQVLLALPGLVCGLRRRTWRRWTLFLLSTVMLAFLLSLGPHLTIGGWTPWLTLTALVPGLAQVRSTYRFACFVQMGTVLLAAQGLFGLWLWKSAAWGRRRWQTAARVLMIGLGGLLALEVRPGPLILTPVPDVAPHRDWIALLRERTPSGRGAVCLPFAPGPLTQDFEGTVRWMYLGTFHGVPLVNGYSGFFPATEVELRELVNRAFPSAEVLTRLRNMQVDYLVVDRERYPPATMAQAGRALEHVLASPGGVDVYRLAGEGSPASSTGGASAP